jgi:hypothetical protein
VTTAKLSLSYVSQALAVLAVVLGLLRLARRRQAVS